MTATSDVRPAPEARRRALWPAFVGEIQQVPPAFSAIKVDGERAYDLAREGGEVELEPRPVAIHASRCWRRPTPTTPSSRSTAARAPMSAPWSATWPRRSAPAAMSPRSGAPGWGGFRDDAAISLENLEDLVHRGARSEALLPVETALDDIPALAVTTEDAFRLTQGRSDRSRFPGRSKR